MRYKAHTFLLQFLVGLIVPIELQVGYLPTTPEYLPVGFAFLKRMGYSFNPLVQIIGFLYAENWVLACDDVFPEKTKIFVAILECSLLTDAVVDERRVDDTRL